MNSYQKDENPPLILFYSYADEDEKLCVELEKHLSLLQMQGAILGWHRRKTPAGAKKDAISSTYLSSAQIILLLISADFLASDVALKEMQQALEWHKKNHVQVIPLLLRPCDWRLAPFAHLEMLPHNKKAITTWRNRDLAFLEVATSIRSLVMQTLNAGAHQIILPPLPFVFLSYAREEEDLSLVNRLKDDLQLHGIKGWIDSTLLPLGNSDEEELRVAIRNASAVVLVISGQTRRSRAVKEEISIAQMYQHPIYLFWMQGDSLEEVIPTNCKGLPFFDARAERYPQALQELAQIFDQRLPSLSLDLSSEKRASSSKIAKSRNPYKGLRAFRSEDAADFFGRDRLIDELIGQIRRRLTTNMSIDEEARARLIAVTGPSGSGKSSLVMAGLVPQLQQGALLGSQNWVYLDIILPGTHPLGTLAVALTKLFPERTSENILYDLQGDSRRGLHLLLTGYTKQANKHVFLVIDQCEELFTLTATEEERKCFLDLLVTATTEPHGPLFAVLAMRADFYGRLLLYPELARLIETSHLTVYPLDIQEQRAVIEQPAHLPDVQVRFEDNLVGELLFDIREQAGALPLLQFTLDRLFRERQGWMLTLRAYADMGGVVGALTGHADEMYNNLPSENHQKLAQALFFRLMHLERLEKSVTKRRIPLSALTLIDPQKTEVLANVREIFTDGRLLTTNTIGDVSTVEVSHEVLIDKWERLQEWLHKEQDTLHLQQTIGEDAIEWKRYDHSPDRLYRGDQLVEALLWRNTHFPNIDEDAFLQASVEEEQYRETQQEQQQRYTRRVVVTGIIVGTLGLGGSGLGLLAFIRGRNSQAPYRIIQATPSPKSLPYAMNSHSLSVKCAAWSPDGKRIAFTGSDQLVQIWDVSSGALLRIYVPQRSAGLGDYGIDHVAWSPDGRRIASANNSKSVDIWDANTGKSLFIYEGHRDGVFSLAWSPDGKSIVSAGADHLVQVWDASNGSSLIPSLPIGGLVYSLAWSPDGKSIVSAGADHLVQVWDASNGSYIFSHSGHTNIVTSVAWSPDSKRIVSSSIDATIQVWGVSSGNPIYVNHTSGVNCVNWSPDGRRLVSAGKDKMVQIWNANNGASLCSYEGHTSAVNSVAWSPDSKHVVSAGGDGTAWVWDLSNGSPILSYTGHTSGVTSAAWSPDSKYIVSASLDYTVQVWDASSGSSRFTYTGHTRSVNSAIWSPDGKLVASAGADYAVQVWDANNGNPLFSHNGYTNLVNCVAWSPDGKRIATADGNLQIFDASSGAPVRTYIGQPNIVSSVAWSPDGKQIASAGWYVFSADKNKKTVQVWSTNNDGPLFSYPGHTGKVNSVAWSPDGKQIASAGEDETVQVWNASNGNPLFSVKGHIGSINSVAWSPDGKQIASAGGDDDTVRVWDASNGNPLFSYSHHTSGVNSVAWSPDGTRIASASQDDTVQVWWML
jgi:WD40 repeat protein